MNQHPVDPTPSPLATPIAVVGMAAWYPGARDPRQLWENILARRREFRLMPDERLPLSDYYDPDPAAPDKTYGRFGAYIDGFQFDCASHRIPKRTFDETDIAQWLALEVAGKALADFGHPGKALPHDRTGVILGNTLTGENTRAHNLRTRWPFVRRAFLAATAGRGLPQDRLDEALAAMEALYKSVFPPVTEDWLAGGLSNTIAGRVCNYFDLRGGGYTVDGACASSLLAVCTAASHLERGDLDLALAGGVDISLDNFELIGFAKAGALTPDQMRVYDRRANGFIPGEGCGFVVLRRLEDALAAADNIYAVIRGWGVSSDGKGGIMAPSRQGQALALRRAYERAGYSPHDLLFVEGHGTGTATGDRIELSAVASLMESYGAKAARSCAMTSLKSIVGHTKAAAGIGAFIKAVMAVNRRVIPPTAGCSQPSEVFETAAQCLYPALQGEILDLRTTVRAGVSGMGFGGINAHVTLESATIPSFKLLPTVDERALLCSAQETEIFVLAAGSAAGLLERAAALAATCERISQGELTDLSAHLAQQAEAGATLRAAVIAHTPESLAQKLRALVLLLQEGEPAQGVTAVGPQRDLWIGHGARKARVGFLLPGQGSQQLLMGRVLVERFHWARELVARVDRWLEQAGGPALSPLIYRPLHRARDEQEQKAWAHELAQTEVAQPAICLASLLFARYLERLGVVPAALGGHSLGELSAFHLAGAFGGAERSGAPFIDEQTLFRFAALRGQAMQAKAAQAGAMASLLCSREQAEALIALQRGYAVVANINSLRQVAVSGEAAAIEAVIGLAQAAGVAARLLPVSNAFHSRLMGEAAALLAREAPVPRLPVALAVPLFSSVDGCRVSRDLDHREHFAAQVLAPVDFVRLAQAMQGECDVLLEVGPGRVLSGLVADTLGPMGLRCLPVAAQQPGDADLNRALAALYVHGVEIKWPELYAERLVRPFVTSRSFWRSPCERPFAVAGMDVAGRAVPARPRTGSPPPVGPRPAALSADTVLPLERLLPELVSRITGYPLGSISLEARLLDDLNLDSIKSAVLVAESAAAAGVAGRIKDPFRLANARLSELADALRAAGAGQAPAPAAPAPKEEPARGPIGEQAPAPAWFPAHPDAATGEPPHQWVRDFAVDLVEEDLPGPAVAAGAARWPGAHVLVLAEPEEAEVSEALRAHLRAQGAYCHASAFAGTADGRPPGTHVIAVLPRRGAAKDEPAVRIHRMMERLRAAALPAMATSSQPTLLAFVQFGGGWFGRAPGAADPETCCADAFARSIYLERPALCVRVVDLAATLTPAQVAERVLAELLDPAPFSAAGYDAALVRRVPRARLQQPARYQRRSPGLSLADVVLVTGGGKGITAECAHALGLATGARLALVGSTPAPRGPEDGDAELCRNLDRLRKAGVEARYYCCDLSDAGSVALLVEQVRAEWGPITAVVHGAGRNHPRPLEQVSLQEALAEVGPKLLGMLHLCAALAAQPPRLFIAFTSIIGVMGMQRNAWYGFANECVSVLLKRFAQAHQQTQVLAIAWTVWRDVGMGAKIGIVEKLTDLLGIGAIPVSEGVRRFLALAQRDPEVAQVVVSSSFGTGSSWQRERPAVPPGLRFVEEVVLLEPGVELLARAHLTLQRDRYLADHDFRGSYLFPTVFGLEAMAQAAYALDPSPVTRIEDIRLLRPITVSASAGARIEIHVELLEEEAGGTRKAAARIRTEQTGFAQDHFSAVLVLGSPAEGPSLPAESSDAPLPLRPRADLYGGVLFQGALFQRMESIQALDSRRVVLHAAAGAVPIGDGGVAGAEGPRFLLGDPYLRDVLLQSVQLTVPRHVCLPVHIGGMDLFRAPAPVGRIITGIFHGTQGREDLTEVIMTDDAGRVVEHIRDYRLHILEERPEHPRAEDIAAPGDFDERLVAGAVERALGGCGLLVPAVVLELLPGLHDLQREARRQRERPLVLRAVDAWRQQRGEGGVGEGGVGEGGVGEGGVGEGGVGEGGSGEVALGWLPSGKPRLVGLGEDIDLSLSHDNRYCLCVVGRGPQGCDLAPVIQRDQAQWDQILTADHARLMGELMRGGDSRSQAGTRLWAALEAARKASAARGLALSMRGRTGAVVHLRADTTAGPYSVVTLPVLLSRGPERVVAVVAGPVEAER